MEKFSSIAVDEFRTYTIPELEQLTRINARKLRVWYTKKILEPSVPDGNHGRFTLSDLKKAFEKIKEQKKEKVFDASKTTKKALPKKNTVLSLKEQLSEIAKAC